MWLASTIRFIRRTWNLTEAQALEIQKLAGGGDYSTKVLARDMRREGLI